MILYIENSLIESNRGIVSDNNNHQMMKTRMEKINILTKTFDTSSLEREFNETKKMFG